MTQDEIIRMAREAGIQVTIDWAGRPTMVSIGVNGNVGLTGTEELERFAALVAAHERESFKVYVNQVVADREMAVHDAVLAEREACAKVCEELAKGFNEEADNSRLWCAAAIRARGEK